MLLFIELSVIAIFDVSLFGYDLEQSFPLRRLSFKVSEFAFSLVEPSLI